MCGKSLQHIFKLADKDSWSEIGRNRILNKDSLTWMLMVSMIHSTSFPSSLRPPVSVLRPPWDLVVCSQALRASGSFPSPFQAPTYWPPPCTPGVHCTLHVHPHTHARANLYPCSSLSLKWFYSSASLLTFTDSWLIQQGKINFHENSITLYNTLTTQGADACPLITPLHIIHSVLTKHLWHVG